MEFTSDSDDARDALRRKLRGRRVSVVAASGAGVDRPGEVDRPGAGAEDTSTQEQVPEQVRPLTLTDTGKGCHLHRST